MYHVTGLPACVNVAARKQQRRYMLLEHSSMDVRAIEVLAVGVSQKCAIGFPDPCNTPALRLVIGIAGTC